ncbi:hypothetical protein F0562_006375 [Nyssa sinensis]|uniref:HMA domain-containing protein n=1 Tax=Nyssa sinensis TaxID=561372 RepID=A0A5J5ANW9_9ASTE|nr:hypothetical protein F0562_006375 [Nyssa sinensis]
MVQRTVLKVDLSCQKCKKKVLKAVSGLQGVDKIEIDGAKGTLTVTGEADPYEIIVQTRKAGRFAEVVTVGAPPKPEAQKKPEEKKPEQKVQPVIQAPHSCPVCDRMAIIQMTSWVEPSPSCSIL